MKRNVSISLKTAQEWYNSGNESLREIALQAFKEGELIEKPWELIKTFEDACMVLNINPENVDLIADVHLQNVYKLQIVRKALNGASWKPKLNTETIYYPWMRYYPIGNSRESKWRPVANFKNKEDNKVYTLVGGDYYSSKGWLGSFRCGWGTIAASRGLFGCKSEEIAKYFGVTFGKLIFDVIYGQYNDYYWI